MSFILYTHTYYIYIYIFLFVSSMGKHIAFMFRKKHSNNCPIFLTVFPIGSTIYLFVNINATTVPRSHAITWFITLHHTDRKENLL